MTGSTMSGVLMTDGLVPQCDLGRLRAVGQLEGRDMAKSLSAPFIECSAADGVNVEVAFRELVKLVRKDERVSGSFSPLSCPSVSPNHLPPTICHSLIAGEMVIRLAFEFGSLPIATPALACLTSHPVFATSSIVFFFLTSCFNSRHPCHGIGAAPR